VLPLDSVDLPLLSEWEIFSAREEQAAFFARLAAGCTMTATVVVVASVTLL
jgi:hypothetical protein